MLQSMTRFSFFIFMVVFGTNSALCSAAALNQDWVVQTVTGTVAITGSASGSTRVQSGARLAAPFTVQTGADGVIALAHGQDKLTVKPNSVASVPLAAASPTGVTTRISQTLGTAFYQVQHRIKDRFEVETPYLVSVVKGTTFNVHVSLASSTVALIEGRVQVSTPDGKMQHMLEPGQTATKTGQGDEIIIKSQQTLSSPAQGPIRIANEGGQAGLTAETTLPPASLGGYAVLGTAVPATNVGVLAAGTSIDLGVNVANGTSNLGTTNIAISTNTGISVGGGAGVGATAAVSAGTGGVSANVGGVSAGVGGISVGVGGVAAVITPPVSGLGGLLGL